MSSGVTIERVPLDSRDFDALRRLIQEAAGIHLGDQKRDLVAGRLQCRLRHLRISTFGEYLQFLAAEVTGDETREMVNCITTNKTSFFREPHHFDFIRDRLVPECIARAQAGAPRKIRIWSAACSMGHEPWSIAMTLADALGSFSGWDIRILASDLDTNVLATAEAATYDELAVADIPPPLRTKYLEPAPEGGGLQRVVAPLRSLVTFRRLNLVNPGTWSIRTKFDTIMCRNVAIYFDRLTQELVFKALASLLEPSGYLMSGHSENLHWLADVLTPMGKTIHARADGIPPAPKSGTRPTVRGALLGRAVIPPSPVPAILGGGMPSFGTGPEIAIQVGGVQASAKGGVIRTTLGSCVAVCLHDPERRIGGMNHFLLPADNGSSRHASHFGVHSMELLINALMKLGAERSRLVAKVFGGGATMGGALSTSVGKRNAEFAIGFLEDEGIRVAGKKVGGRAALSVLFDTDSGLARVKEIGAIAEINREEQRVLARISQSPPPIEQDITFFGLP